MKYYYIVLLMAINLILYAPPPTSASMNDTRTSAIHEFKQPANSGIPTFSGIIAFCSCCCETTLTIAAICIKSAINKHKLDSREQLSQSMHERID